MAESTILLKLFFSTSHIQSSADPPPSRSERKASRCPSGDHFGSHLSPVFPVRFLVSPVSVFTIQISLPFSSPATPLRRVVSLPIGLALLSASITYASHLSSGETSTEDQLANERTRSTSS